VKVAFVTNAKLGLNESFRWTGYANGPMIERMPCDVTTCLSLEEVKRIAPNVDVVLLDLAGWIDFRKELTFLNDLPVVVGGFHLDSWKGPFWCDEPVDVDLYICIYKTVTSKAKPALMDPDKYLWLPPRVDVFDYDVPRDIDVITWGHRGREYIFRLFTFWALACLNAAGPRRRNPEAKNVDPYLWLRPIILDGKKYIWADLRVKMAAPAYHGPQLFELLHRCKLCATGPPVQANSDVPVARFIEDAACGVVSMTCDIDDKKELGFVHGQNIWITGVENFANDLIYLLEHPKRVEEISKNAKALVRERHTIDIRAQKLYKVLCEKTGKS